MAYTPYIWLCQHVLDPVLRRTKREIACKLKEERAFFVLDMCTATGSLCNSIEDKGMVAVGLDLNHAILCKSNEKDSKKKLVCADAALTPFRSDCFDAITFTFALHDKSAALQSRILVEAFRVLKPGGKIIAVDYAPWWSCASFLGHVFRYFIEAASGHYSNGMNFIQRGGIAKVVSNQGLRILLEKKHSWRRCAALIVAVKEL